MAARLTQEEIFLQYHDKIFFYILKKVQNHEVAEDLTSIVFLKVYEKYDSFDDTKSSISTWIYTIAGNSVIDYYRTNHITEEVPEEIEMDSRVEDSVLAEETLEELAAALLKLEERERDLIILHYYQNRTLRDIAQIMGMSYANVKIIHSKALKKMKGILS